MRTNFSKIKIGMDDKDGWSVSYGNKLIAILREDEEGRIILLAGFEQPYICVFQSWPSLSQAKYDFRAWCQVYRLGITPTHVADHIFQASRSIDPRAKAI